MIRSLSALIARVAAALRTSPASKSPPVRTPPVETPPVEESPTERPAGELPVLEWLSRELTATERTFTAASNDFTFELLRQVHPQEGSPNAFVSPLGVSMALGMVLNGAAGDTFDAMRTALGFDSLTQEEINRSFHELTTMLPGLEPYATARMCNAAFAARSHPFVPSFSETVRDRLNAEAWTVDLDDPSTVDTINRWVSERTKGLIPGIIDGLVASPMPFLVNATYFSAHWVDKFDEHSTMLRPFTLANGAQVQVKMLMGDVGARLHEAPDALVGELPYEGPFVMNVVLPRATATLDDLIADLDGDTWAGWTSGLPDDGRTQPMQVAMPELTFRTHNELNTPLANMGMDIAFDPGRADLSRMVATPGACIGSVLHSAYVKVDAWGTTAAAVTKIRTLSMDYPYNPPVVRALIVDRPYLLLIREQRSGIILFIGAITDPRAAQ